MLFQLFENCKEMGNGFTYTIKRDADKKITHVFWANGSFRSAYKVFGDVVTFDTTYKTNCYELIFAAFVGCNRHGQTTFLDVGFYQMKKRRHLSGCLTHGLKPCHIAHQRVL